MKKHKNAHGLNLALISQYRAVLMGTAILLILLCHLDTARIHNGIESSRLSKLLQANTVGVDIFMFLSGFGLYYSYSKRQQPYLQFEKRRLLRILPMYIIIAGTTYLISDLVINRLPLSRFLWDLTFVSWFREGSTRYWYVLASIVFYLIFPLLFRVIHRTKHEIRTTVAFCVLWWTVTELLFWKWSGLSTFRMPLARLPIFTIGICCGKLSKGSFKISPVAVVLLVLLGFAAFWGLEKIVPQPYVRSLYYPVRGLFGLAIICLIIFVMEALLRAAPRVHTILVKILSWFGGLTLELYLLHQSYLILLNYPYRVPGYIGAAFLLPTATAALIFLARKARRKREKV